MKFSELCGKDTVGAFSEFLSVAQAKEEGLFPADYHSAFDNECTCGSERIIKKSLTSMMCCDPRCPIKLGYTLAYLFSKFNCKHIGEQTCKSIMSYSYSFLKNKSHLEVLNLEDKYLPVDISGMALSNFLQAVRKVKQTKVTFAGMVANLGIPGFDTSSLKLFSDISGVNDLISKIEQAGSIEAFLNYRGVYDKTKVFYLGEFLPDIAYSEMQVFSRLLPVGKKKITIVITGELRIEGTRITKNAFVDLCNQIGQISAGIRLFDVQMNSAIESTAYVIADEESSNFKYVTARRRESEEGRKIIYSSMEFIDYLRDLVTLVSQGVNKQDDSSERVAEEEVHVGE